MKRLYVLLLLVASFAPAHAQQLQQPPGPAPSFVPITLDQAALQQLQNYLNTNVPPTWQAPMLQWLNAMEQKAQADQAKKVIAAPARSVPATSPKK